MGKRKAPLRAVRRDARGQPIPQALWNNEPLDKSFAEAQRADLSAINKILDRKLKAKTPPRQP